MMFCIYGSYFFVSFKKCTKIYLKKNVSVIFFRGIFRLKIFLLKKKKLERGKCEIEDIFGSRKTKKENR